jgi:hypothetical protein
VEKLWESRRFSQRLSKTQALFTNFSCCHAERRRIGHKPILHSRSIPTGITALHPWIPILGQVQPVWIPQFDHRYLLRPRPAFQLFLSPDCLVLVVVGRPVQKSLHLVPVGETLHLMELMLEHAFVEIAGETDVQGARQAAHDVDAVASPLASHSKGRDASTAEDRLVADPPSLYMTRMWALASPKR